MATGDGDGDGDAVDSGFGVSDAATGVATGLAEVLLWVLGDSVAKGSDAEDGNAPLGRFGAGVADDAAEVCEVPLLDGVTIVGKTDPFKMPPANKTNNSEAKMAP